MRKENKEDHFFTDEELGITAKLSKLNLTKEDQDFLRNGLQEILSHFETMASVNINTELHNETPFQSNNLRPLLELMDSQPAAVVPMAQSHLGGVCIGSEHPHEALGKCFLFSAKAPRLVSDFCVAFLRP